MSRLEIVLLIISVALSIAALILALLVVHAQEMWRRYRAAYDEMHMAVRKQPKHPGDLKYWMDALDRVEEHFK